MPHKYSAAQVEKLVAAKQAHDRGEISDAAFLAVSMESSALERGDAMDQTGGPEAWR